MNDQVAWVALMATPEVAGYLGCSIRMVRKMVFEQRLPYVKVGRLVRFKRCDIDAYIDMRTQAAHGSADDEANDSLDALDVPR